MRLAEHASAARHQDPVKEKEDTRARDALAAKRRRMPMMAVEKDYTSEGARTAPRPLKLSTGACS